MSLHSLLAEVLARPAPAERAARMLDAVVWRLLLGFAILFLLLALWRVLETLLGPILAPLTMALALAVSAAILAFREARKRRKLKAQTPALAPLVATVLEVAFAPKLVRWFALGSFVYDTLMKKASPMALGRKPR